MCRAGLPSLGSSRAPARWAASHHGLNPSSALPQSVPESVPDPAFDGRLAEALRALQSGDSPRAEALYQGLLADGCRDVRLFSNLGAIALQRQEPESAIDWLQQGLALDPGHARCLLNLGMAQQLLGRCRAAIEAFRRSLNADPALPEAWNNLGFALSESHPDATADQDCDGTPGHDSDAAIEEAIAAYRQALRLRPAYGQAASNLSRLLANQGDPQAGEAVLRALPAEALGGEERFGLGEMLRLQGRIDQAIALYGEALALAEAAQQADLRLRVGIALVLCGQADQALMQLLPLIAERPQDARPQVAAGFALQALGDTRQAMDLLDKALLLDPDQTSARNLLGKCHNDLGEHSKAVVQFRAGLRVAPGDEELRCNLAGALRHQGDLEGSMRVISELLEEKPDCREACLIQLFSCSIGGKRLASLGLEIGERYWRSLRRPPGRQSALNASAALPSLSTPTWRSVEPSGGHVWGAPLDPLDRRLRIGFLSAEIGNHVVGSFLSSFLDHYDRDRYAVELFVASRRFDATAERMAAQADHHWLLSGMAMAEARSLIRSRRLDVLVETSGFTRDSGIDLLAERCAPVQCHYIGYHATTALETMDWFIGDAETVPEAFAPQFTERLWRLPRPWLARCPDPSLPRALSGDDSPIPVLGSFNQLTKVREETLTYWSAALRAVPTARLLIKDRSVADPVVCARIRDSLGRAGVAPERITFLPAIGSWEEHMAAYNRIDVALDATPWSSATTGFDALAMGVPLVAIRGDCTSARMSSAILRGLGRPEWISETPERFAAIVADLCSDPTALRRNKPTLQQQVLASPLFDGADLASALQEAFEAIVESKIKNPGRQGRPGIEDG